MTGFGFPTHLSFFTHIESVSSDRTYVEARECVIKAVTKGTGTTLIHFSSHPPLGRDD